MTSNCSLIHSQICHLLYWGDPPHAMLYRYREGETYFARLRYQSLRFTLQMSFSEAWLGYLHRELPSSSCLFKGPHGYYGNFKHTGVLVLAHADDHGQGRVTFILSQLFRRQLLSFHSSYFSRYFAWQFAGGPNWRPSRHLHLHLAHEF